MKTRRILATLALGLGVAMALLWLLGSGMSNVARAQGPDGHDTYYVAPGGDCGGMTPCYSSVQAAVDAVDDPDDVVKVAASAYTGVSAREGVTQMVHISKTVTVRGGYTTINWTTSDPDANSTTLDAQGQGRVLYITGDISPTIEGLRITGGDAAGLGGGYFGFDCGGGVYLNHRDVNNASTLSNNQVFSNTAHIGGGVCVYYGAAKLNDNTISFNTASDGGGLWLNFDTATLSGNTIVSNIATQTGGGLFALSSTAVFTGNTIVSNTSSNMGGGLFFQGGDGTLSGNVIRGNADSGTGYQWNGGGGWYMCCGSTLVLINNVIADNWAISGRGSGLVIRESSPHLLHTTIARNSGDDGSGVYVFSEGSGSSTVALTNTILVSHSVGISVTGGHTVTINGILWYSTPVTVSQSITASVMVQNQHTGDPAFATDGYHLMAGSAAIDKGIVDTGVTVDIDGESRPASAGYDLGADELWCKIYLPLVLRNY